MFHTISLREDIFSMESNRFEEIIISLKEKNIVKFEEIKSNPNSIAITFDDGYRDNFDTAYPILKNYGIPFTIFIATGLIGKQDYMNSEHIKTLSEDPLVTIGGHGHSHEPFKEKTLAEVISELEQSKNILEGIINREVCTMSYPHGSYNEEILKATYRAGFKYIGTSDFSSHQDKKDTINRIAIYSCDTEKSVHNKINGKWESFKKWL